MTVIWAICRRDLLHQFTTPRAWLVLACWTLITNFVFWWSLSATHSAGASEVPLYLWTMQWGAYALILLAPAITMDGFASERVLGTEQLLLSAPITELQLILGKFLAAFLMLLCLVATTLVQPLVLYLVSDTGGLQLLAGYLGLVLACALFAGLGTWVGLLVDSPVAAYVLTMGAILVLLLTGMLADPALDAWAPLSALGEHMGLDEHLRPLREGRLHVADVGWFVVATAACLVLAHGALCTRRIHG